MILFGVSFAYKLNLYLNTLIISVYLLATKETKV